MNRKTKVLVVPLTLPTANKLVDLLHRHHAPIPGGFAWFCVGAVVGGGLIGCAIAGRPTNRNNDDKQTVEVLRLATDGTPNACSALLGACARAAKAIGARRCITYTLTTETGVSLRGAGWVCTAENTGKSWWENTNTRAGAVPRGHMATEKRRWEKQFRDQAVEYQTPQNAELSSPQLALFGD